MTRDLKVFIGIVYYKIYNVLYIYENKYIIICAFL